MSPLAYINIFIAIIGLVSAVYAIRILPAQRCGQPLIGDALVLVAYLMMINSHHMAQGTEYAGLANEAWHVFSLVVLINIVIHIRMVSGRRVR